jgi:hypothetical protein
LAVVAGFDPRTVNLLAMMEFFELVDGTLDHRALAATRRAQPATRPEIHQRNQREPASQKEPSVPQDKSPASKPESLRLEAAASEPETGGRARGSVQDTREDPGAPQVANLRPDKCPLV